MREWLIYFTCNLFVNLSGRMVNERRDEKATQGITRRRIYFFFYINLSSKTRKKLKTKSIECGSRLLRLSVSRIQFRPKGNCEWKLETTLQLKRLEVNLIFTTRLHEISASELLWSEWSWRDVKYRIYFWGDLNGM